MKLMAAGAALAGIGPLAGCMEPPNERIMPRATGSPELTPGVPVSYATSMTLDGYATGLLVHTLEARPIKVDGNPEHPSSLGGTTPREQASVLSLYDPDRPAGASRAKMPIALDRVLGEIARRERIGGLWFLLAPQSSPLIATLLERIRRRHPGARFAYHAALDRRAVFEGARLVFGRPLETQYRFARADVVVSLDADFMAGMPSSPRWARQFAERRRLRAPTSDMSRLYVAEPRPTPTGSIADHRLPARASKIARIASALLAAITKTATAEAPPLTPREQRWVDEAAADLIANPGRGLVVVGDRQPAIVHAAVHLINHAIAAPASTLAYTEPAILDPLGDDLATVAAEIRAGRVETLVIGDTNPVYTAPADIGFAPLLARVPETIAASSERDETAAACDTFVPLSHYMETWSDGRAYDGTITLCQPVIRKLHDSASLVELLAAFAGEHHADGHRLLRDHYTGATDVQLPAWYRTLQRGFVEGSAFAAVDDAPVLGATAASEQLARIASTNTSMEVSFEPSHAVYDGRFSSNAWLQELPAPMTKITWGNAALMSVATARALEVDTEDVVEIAASGSSLELPVYVLPGHADHAISIDLGYGRSGVGANTYRLVTSRAPRFATKVRVARTGRRATIAATQKEFGRHGREIALAFDLVAYRANPDLTARHRGPVPDLLPDHFEDTPAWGMTIDTMICTGCSSCVVACQAENNIPVVGRSGVENNREMHWLRIDTYREERGDDVDVVHQPMLCQHCEKAPCEYVCPVYATQHSPDGLNEMVYNRCVGTRFCSNNCPYKVRRFNWFDYTEDTPKTQRLQFNPSVTVRARGVMEKCSFCVQRIRKAEIDASKGHRDIRPGEVVTACQAACPTGAITFGLLSHRDSPVVQWREQPRRYSVLHHLGTQPRVAYLAKIRNPR